jgi:hypothetical protein
MSKIIKVPSQEFFLPPDQFINTKETEIKIEHSLVAISKWESKWHVAFLDDHVEKTNEMMIDYIRCMTITQNVNPIVYLAINQSPEVLKEINDYIDDPMTATTFNNRFMKSGGRGEYVTSELIYYWMISQNIPMDCEKWHLNRLMALIRICSEKNAPSKKMKKSEILNQNRSLNEMRRAKYGTKG